MKPVPILMWFALLAAWFGAGIAVARPPDAPRRVAGGETADVPSGHIGRAGLQASPAGNVCESTGFEAVEPTCGWELGWICGSTFTNCTGPHANVCDPDPIVSLDCCIDNPNPLNGWYVSATNQHCREPHISNENPASGQQHLRLDADPTGGNPPGCTGFGGPCRVNAFTPSAPLGLEPGRTVVSFDVAIVHRQRTDLLYFTIDDIAGSALVIRSSYYGFKLLVYDYGVSNYSQVGSLTGGGQYNNIIADFNPCIGEVNYYLDGVLVYTGSTEAGAQKITRATFNTDNLFFPSLDDSYDIDNYSVVRGPPCEAVCGDGLIELLEECEPNGGTGEACCPGRCGAIGAADECRCSRPFPFAACPNGRPLANGSNGPFLTEGGLFTYTAETPFTSVNTCGSDYDTEILWNISNYCAQFTDYNDECTNSTFGGQQTTGDPFAPCYIPGGFPGESCMCVPTSPGQTYVFLVDEWSSGGFALETPLCSNTIVNIDKKAACESGPISGSCCDRLTGECIEDATLDNCDGEYQVFTDNKTCELSPPCEAMAGACCNRSPGLGGACSETLMADCQGPQLTWTFGATCAEVICEEATGACCDGLIGSCTLRLQGQCDCSHCS